MHFLHWPERNADIRYFVHIGYVISHWWLAHAVVSVACRAGMISQQLARSKCPLSIRCNTSQDRRAGALFYPTHALSGTYTVQIVDKFFPRLRPQAGGSSHTYLGSRRE